MKIRAVVFGATGMVGEGILHVALLHPGVETVLVIGRRSCNVAHPKLTEVIHSDFFDYSALAPRLTGYNACFFCLGVSSLGMKEEKYTRLTYDLTMEAAKILSSLNPGMSFCYISGTGTDSTEHGKIMWARVKGKTENDLMKLPFKAAYMFRPGFIKPMKGLKHGYTISKIVGTMYPVLKMLLPSYVCTLEDLGRAMIAAASTGYRTPILENIDIAKLSHAVKD